jgi:hypothetical protein
MSSFITAQTIITNTSTLTSYPETSIYRLDTFYIQSNMIVWYAPEGGTIYHIVSYTKLSDNLYTIFCNTNGKTITFIVDFQNQWIKIGDKLIFYTTIRL